MILVRQVLLSRPPQYGAPLIEMPHDLPTVIFSDTDILQSPRRNMPYNLRGQMASVFSTPQVETTFTLSNKRTSRYSTRVREIECPMSYHSRPAFDFRNECQLYSRETSGPEVESCWQVRYTSRLNGVNADYTRPGEHDHPVNSGDQKTDNGNFPEVLGVFPVSSPESRCRELRYINDRQYYCQRDEFHI